MASSRVLFLACAGAFLAFLAAQQPASAQSGGLLAQYSNQLAAFCPSLDSSPTPQCGCSNGGQRLVDIRNLVDRTGGSCSGLWASAQALFRCRPAFCTCDRRTRRRPPSASVSLSGGAVPSSESELRVRFLREYPNCANTIG